MSFLLRSLTSKLSFGARPLSSASAAIDQAKVAPFSLSDIPMVEDPPLALNGFHQEYGDFLRNNHKVYHKSELGMVQYNEFGKHNVAVCTPELQKEVCHLEHNGTAKLGTPRFTDNLIGTETIFHHVGEKHNVLRKTIMPLLSSRTLEDRYSLLQTTMDSCLDEMCLQTQKTPNDWLRTYDYNMRLTYDIAIGCLFGIDTPNQTSFLTPQERQLCLEWFPVWLSGMCDSKNAGSTCEDTVFGRAIITRHKILDLVGQVVERIRKAKKDVAKTQNFDQTCIAYNLVDCNPELISDQSVLDTLCIIVFQNNPNIASLNNILYYFDQYPEQRDLIKDAIFEIRDNINGQIDYQDLIANPYLEAFAKECLRHNGPVTGFRRDLLHEHTFSNGVHLPAGITLHVPLIGNTMDENLYSLPTNFDPTRFLTNGQNSKIGKYEYMPFGLGMRKCPGKNLAETEIKLYTTILAHCDYQIDPKRLVYNKETPFRNIDIYAKFYNRPGRN